MRTLFDTEEEIDDKSSEITLSTASLLGIFFGLVLVCGVFFGFGYSMGRGTGWGAHVTAPPSSPSQAEETTAAVNPPAAPTPPPAATAPAGQSPAAAAPAKTDESTDADAKAPAPPAKAQEDDSQPAATDVAESAPGRHQNQALVAAIGKPSAARPFAAYIPPSETPSVSGQPMVQIAAVARWEDANVLVSALRQRGYGVVVRNEPQDKLLHVQVGPFADRGQATAMKQKLLSDGHNAIIKQ
jgi:DedD protein